MKFQPAPSRGSASQKWTSVAPAIETTAARRDIVAPASMTHATPYRAIKPPVKNDGRNMPIRWSRMIPMARSLEWWWATAASGVAVMMKIIVV